MGSMGIGAEKFQTVCEKVATVVRVESHSS